MDGSIGSMLADLGALRAQLAAPAMRRGAGAATPTSSSFASHLDASFRARAEQLGLQLLATETPSTGGSTTKLDPFGTPAEDVAAIWKRVELQSAALHGPGDAMMQAVADAADARWEQRRRGGGGDLFDM